MRRRKGETVISSAVGSDFPSKEKHPRKPLCHQSSTHKDHRRDNGDTKADLQDEGVLSSEANEQDGLPQEVYIKSEPLCEDLWDVLDELGDILDEEHADMSIKRQGNIINMKQGDIVDKEQGVSIYKNEDELDEEEVDVPPAPSISLTDDSSLFTRRSRREADVFPFSFNGSLYESGEILSSKEGRSAGKKPVCNNILPEIALVRSQKSPEQSSKRCIINAFLERRFSSENRINRRSTRSTSNEKSASQSKSVSSSRTPGHRKRRNSRSPKVPKQSLSPPIHRRRTSQSRDHNRSRRRSYSRDRLERCRRLPSRRKLSSRSLSPDRRSRSRYVRNSPLGRESKDASPCLGSRHRSRISPNVGWRRASRNSPVHHSRYRSRSNCRPTNTAVQHQIETRSYLCDRWRSRSRSARKTLRKCSRSKSKSARITQQEHSKSSSKSRSKSKNRPSKTVACQHSRIRSNSPQNRSKSSSQPAPTQQLNTFENRPRVPGIVTGIVDERQSLDQPFQAFSPPLPAISPRPISPLVTLHDNRASWPKEMLQYLLPTPKVPQIVFTQTHYTQTEYSSHAGNFPSSYGQPFPELGPYDLRHRLSTTRSLYYVGPNDLRHSIGEIYSPQPALNGYTEWPTGVTEQYDHSIYF
ncbi:uncharacterized protein Dyak_GE22633 [Drosophila yakuba]|uniref:Uncharacterized protein n=1 Tax=Drosophila yakuba TaxID=7245 RepID=B4PIP2_DROYA|nr:uncharacterized protein Dyak_GE22633 [Drosophila yakuba]